jgi:hypothetical protein
MSRSLILLACFIAACRTTAPGENQGFTTTDSAGTQLVINRTAAWPNGTGWQVDTTPITRIGANEGEPQQHFQYVQQGTSAPFRAAAKVRVSSAKSAT